MLALFALTVALVAGCGPELTTPSSTDISGSWVSSDTAAGVTDFRLVVSQGSDGALTGSWFGRALEVDGACPEKLTCAPTNDIAGSHTVFQIHIDLIGLGAFIGQAADDDQFRGHVGRAELTFYRAVEVTTRGLTGMSR